MGIKHKGDPDNVTVHANESRSVRTGGAFASIARVENCPCEDGVRRTVHATAEAGTFWSIPACTYVTVDGACKTVGGSLVSEDDGWEFVVNQAGTNAALIAKKE